MRTGARALIDVSDEPPTVSPVTNERRTYMRKRTSIVVVSAAALVLAGGGYALAGGPTGGGIWDDGHYAQPGALDDGKDLLPQTKISLADAVAAAKRAESGALGQVDLETRDGRLVYTVDIGNQEVHVDAADGSIASVTPRD
jgi:uncharacterized membrane protein YkoI